VLAVAGVARGLDDDRRDLGAGGGFAGALDPLVNPMLSAMTSGRPAAGAVLLGALSSVTALALNAVSVGTLVHRRA
jgi:hypothetical protein